MKLGGKRSRTEAVGGGEGLPIEVRHDCASGGPSGLDQLYHLRPRGVEMGKPAHAGEGTVGAHQRVSSGQHHGRGEDSIEHAQTVMLLEEPQGQRKLSISWGDQRAQESQQFPSSVGGIVAVTPPRPYVNELLDDLDGRARFHSIL